MSLASRGTLEVDHYVGRCLIRPGLHKVTVGKKEEVLKTSFYGGLSFRDCYDHCQGFVSSSDHCQNFIQCHQQSQDTWTGAPLISVASGARRCGQKSLKVIQKQQQKLQEQQQQESIQELQQASNQQISSHLPSWVDSYSEQIHHQQQQQISDQQISSHQSGNPQQHQQQSQQQQFVSEQQISNHLLSWVDSYPQHVQQQQQQQQQQQMSDQQISSHQSRNPQQRQKQQQHQQLHQISDHQISRNIILPKSPLSRLAIHTQGAPLILANRFHNRGKLLNNSLNPNLGITSTLVNSYDHSSGNTIAMKNITRCPVPRAQRLSGLEEAKKQPGSLSNKVDKEMGPGRNINIDSLSIASDESSGSNNSENSLPRIIKPRKRRKKDRKPINGLGNSSEIGKQEQHQVSSLNSLLRTTEQSNVIPPKPSYEQCYELPPPQFWAQRRLPMATQGYLRESVQTRGLSTQEIVDIKQSHAHRHLEVVLDDNRNFLPDQIYKLPLKGFRNNGDYLNNRNSSHYYEYSNLTESFPCEEDLKNNLESSSGEKGLKSNLKSSQCPYKEDLKSDLRSFSCKEDLKSVLTSQCLYCHPSGLLWDQDFYSSFLTPSRDFCPNLSLCLSSLPVFSSQRTLNCQEQRRSNLSDKKLLSADSSQSQKAKDSSNSVLRRSWSDPSNHCSEISTSGRSNLCFGVIGDRGQTENGKKTLWQSDIIDDPRNNIGSGTTSTNPKGLEVSTEIITSPNGHRDLEIRFYSSGAETPAPEEDKIVLAEEKIVITEDKVLCEDLEESEEDFSDIWRYHDSKLQQDFHILLQAEE
ncbi:uncharacterized protein LOC143187331 [Calliopsis andreniformis]|uniref:uncharacterized protein LOC143187331 n=1 Tax=Calliopsis andreniformis TaxID=337506 RepID=UPI003FCE7623